MICVTAVGERRGSGEAREAGGGVRGAGGGGGTRRVGGHGRSH